jgi:hypothetical protein
MRLRLIAASVVTLTACIDADDPISTDELLEPSPTYRIASTLDVPTSAVVPGGVATVLDVMRELQARPAVTLFALAERAGVPAVSSLGDALPEVLELRLESAIDGHVRGVLRDHPAAAAALAQATVTAEAVLGKLALTSELVITRGSAEHRLLTVGFTVDRVSTSFDVAGAPLTTATATTEHFPLSDVHTTVSVAAHGFGLPIGSYALQVIDAALARRVGGDLRRVLGDAVDCAGMAASVADECVLDACIGHEDDLLDVCEGALDRLVDELGGRVSGAGREVLHLEPSAMRMFDGDGDGVGEDLSGSWRATIDLGMGPRQASGSFATAPAR